MTHATATLLLVDDNPMNRDALSRRLSAKGYAVITAESGAEALDVVGSSNVDAVLLDVMMPDMSGIDTLRVLRESHSASELPVIMVTARDQSEDVVEALELGANDYITKPVDFPVALARIRTQIASRRVDPLTGLPNRATFMDRLNRSMARTTLAAPSSCAVFFLDVDHFKAVNDRLGHLVGDELLIGLARRLEGALRGTDLVSRFGVESTVARLGGDEFTILLDRVHSATDAASIAERLIGVLAEPFVIQGREVYASASIGIALSSPRYTTAAEMIRDADAAMYQAKSDGKGRWAMFDQSMLEAVERRILIEADLRSVLERGELQLHYQPIVSISSGRLMGFEALLRWLHPTRGLILPGEFITVAEDTGLIVPIGAWVLHEACAQMHRWQTEFPDYAGLVVNVNLSPRQLLHPGIVGETATALAATGLPAASLKLEITEGVMVDRTDQVLQVLNDLRRLGVQLGLDDFGMGYSALGYLSRFPFQTLKIDRCFVSGMHETANAEIIRAIVAMAEGLSMDVTAEGVETAQQLENLRDLSCGSAQGYFFNKPMTPAAARDILRGVRDGTAS